MNRKNRFINQIVIVTGASSGIGRATALAFAREGAVIVLASRSREKLQRVADEIKHYNAQVKVCVIPTDVSSQVQVESLVQAVIAEFGRVDILISNAGSGVVGPVECEQFIDDARQVLEVDYFGQVYCTRAVLPIMRTQGHGAIVNMSSVVGRKAFANFAALSATLHAVTAFSDALRQELRGTAIGVTTVHPALTQSAFFDAFNTTDIPAPFRKMLPVAAETVAQKILNAVSKKQARVIVPWQPRLLLLSDALSARLGDLMVRLLQNSFFMRLIGMYQGRGYSLGMDSAKGSSETSMRI